MTGVQTCALPIFWRRQDTFTRLPVINSLAASLDAASPRSTSTLSRRRRADAFATKFSDQSENPGCRKTLFLHLFRSGSVWDISILDSQRNDPARKSQNGSPCRNSFSDAADLVTILHDDHEGMGRRFLTVNAPRCFWRPCFWRRMFSRSSTNRPTIWMPRPVRSSSIISTQIGRAHV